MRLLPNCNQKLPAPTCAAPVTSLAPPPSCTASLGPLGLGGFCSNFYLFFFSFFLLLLTFFFNSPIFLDYAGFDCENLHSIHACKHFKTDSE